MGDRLRRLVAEATRFLAVGGLATIVAAVLFNVLVHGVGLFDRALLSDQPIVAYVLANLVGMVISYRGTRSWAFRHRVPAHADGGRTAFLIINVLTMTIPVACLWVSRTLLGLDDPVSDNISANVVGLALGVGARFWLFRTFVFTHPDASDARTQALGAGQAPPPALPVAEAAAPILDPGPEARGTIVSEGPTVPARRAPAAAPAPAASAGSPRPRCGSRPPRR
ncbi:GtrA family protein [Nocardioides bruguierae]|uniref:GtrA family protein n=1 Tax=Nocardioides bruguierae TaxID=2945102 RepID=A0A9X2D948_9ACTN|nr:GtrA family protein [Nocardioides bruguierae]MCM0621319.1 GtrA family protein [Nocardioides bruguierae]